MIIDKNIQLLVLPQHGDNWALPNYRRCQSSPPSASIMKLPAYRVKDGENKNIHIARILSRKIVR